MNYQVDLSILPLQTVFEIQDARNGRQQIFHDCPNLKIKDKQGMIEYVSGGTLHGVPAPL